MIVATRRCKREKKKGKELRWKTEIRSEIVIRDTSIVARDRRSEKRSDK